MRAGGFLFNQKQCTLQKEGNYVFTFNSDRLINRRILADSIYADVPLACIDLVVEVEAIFISELSKFLSEFIKYLGVSDPGSLLTRVDVIPDQKCHPYLIECNVEEADGWGVVTNLYGAIRHKLDKRLVNMLPSRVKTFPNDSRMTEFFVAKEEFKRLGRDLCIDVLRDRYSDPLDSKNHLANFSQNWKNDVLSIPKMYMSPKCAWEDLPEDVFLKKLQKHGKNSGGRGSVGLRGGIGGNEQKSFSSGELMAQEVVRPYVHESLGLKSQFVFMCSGVTPVGGYVQWHDPKTKVAGDKGALLSPIVF